MATLEQLWHEATYGTPWNEIDLKRELANCEKLAVRPRIPADHLIFRIFRAFPQPQTQIKVVLLGQDPYPEVLQIANPNGENEILVSRACGFSFSSPYGSLPVSLRTVFAELLTEYPQVSDPGEKKPPLPSEYSGDLSYLVSDGVFLVNTFLTIALEGNHGKSGSHPSWSSFTTQILKFIRRNCPNVVYLALGKPAADMLSSSGITTAIACDHPAARGGGRNPFRGSNIFKLANAQLAKRGIGEVDWVPMRKPVDTRYYDASLVVPKWIQAITFQPIITEDPAEGSVYEDEEEEEDE